LRFLNRVISAKVWEVLVLFVVIAIAATVYRVYFSRAVALTQVCDRLAEIQNDEVADMFNQLTGDAEPVASGGQPALRGAAPMKEAR